MNARTRALAAETLAERWRLWREEHPRGRTIEAARALEVSEGALIASRCGEPSTCRLGPKMKPILTDLHTLGPVMALTRNLWAVHEKVGAYPAFEGGGPHGLFLSEDIDLRLFLWQWAHAFAVEVPTRTGPRWSLQFFSKAGLALHKIYLREESDAAAFKALVAAHAHEDQAPGLAQEPPTPEEVVEPAPVTPEQTEALIEGWRALEDTHDYFGLLRKVKVTRHQAMLVAPDDLALSLSLDAATRLLHQAAEDEVPIMCFVGNEGCIQIHSGPVKQIKPMGPWINVMDPGFNLHLRADLVVEAYRVVKPTVDGPVTSVELYAEGGQLIGQFFGVRKPGQPEDPRWRALANAL